MESTGILGNDIEVSAEGAEGPSVKGVRVGDAVDLRTGRVHCMMDHVC